MKGPKIYQRKISSEEAREGYILVLKNWLPFFPGVGELFEVDARGTVRKVRVESYPCTCRGLDKPHEHYFIRWPGLQAGDWVEITKDPGGNGYGLRVQSSSGKE
jgi:hypothetical protein